MLQLLADAIVLKRCAACPHTILAPLVLLAVLETAFASAPSNGSRVNAGHRIQHHRLSLRAATSASTAHFRRLNSEPTLADATKPMELAREDVLVGFITLEGKLPMNKRGDVNDCVKRALATVAVISANQISMSVTEEFSDVAQQVVKFHFVLLPIKGTASATSIAIEQSAVASGGSSGGSAVFLVHLFNEMRQLPSLSEYYVLGLQYKCRAPLPAVQSMQIWRNTDYGRYSGQLATTTQAGSTTRAPDPNLCLITYTPCGCASLSTCAWVENSQTGVASCVKSFYGSTGVPCSACSEQARCKDEGCSEVKMPCDCAASKYNCRWDQAAKICKKGSGTSCVSCPRQSQCAAAVPKLVSYMPPSGTFITPKSGQAIRLGFDREIYFMNGAGGDTYLLCDGKSPISIGRPRLKISVNYLILDINGVIAAASTMNNARQCNLLINEGLIKDKYGVPFLGLRSGQYTIDFGDTAAPNILTFDPRNGQTDVAASTVVTITFSEPIKLGPSATSMKLKVSRLGEGDDIEAVAQLELKPPEVKVESQSLKVDLSGLIEEGNQYTISVPSGAVADLEQNAFVGLAPGAYAFKTVQPTGVYQVPGDSSERLPITSLIGIGTGLVIVILFAILSAWKLSRIRAAQRRENQKVAEEHKKLRSSASMFIDTSGRSASRNSLRSGSMTSASVHPELKSSKTFTAFADSGGTVTEDDPFKPPRRAETWVPGKVPVLSQSRRASAPPQQAPSRNSTAKERSASEHGAERAQASVKSVREAAARLNQQHSEAKRRWHETFAQAAAKRAAAAAPAAAEQRRSMSHPPPATKGMSDEQGPRAAAAPGALDSAAPESDVGPKPSKAPASNPAAGTSAGHVPSSPTAEARGASKADASQHNSSSPHPDAKRSQSRTSQGGANASDVTGPNSNDSPALRNQKQNIMQKMRSTMDASVADRKKLMRELVLEWHPDKSGDANAKDVFQYINAQKGWFLCET